jgi:hypothetical protein
MSIAHVPQPYWERPKLLSRSYFTFSRERFAWSPTCWLGTHNPLVAGSSPARPTRYDLVAAVGARLACLLGESIAALSRRLPR